MNGVDVGVGAVFAGYRIERLLGRGGMGTVYLAAHPRLPRSVALKLLNRELFTDNDIRGRFEREADVSARLDHPNIVAVLDRGVDDGLMWISMQYVDGQDASVFRGTALPPERALDIISQTAEALDYAHERDVLHRDVKPANILLTPMRGGGDRALLTDFGIARLRGDARQLTRTGDFLATLAYASPEQLSGVPVDHRSDQYSLACTLFTLLTGESPFPATNPGQVVAAHLTKPAPAASAVTPVSPAFDAVLARALAKDPAERFDSCAEFAYAARYALGSGSSAQPQWKGTSEGVVGGTVSASQRPATSADAAARSGTAPHVLADPGVHGLPGVNGAPSDPAAPTLVSAPGHAVREPAQQSGTVWPTPAAFGASGPVGATMAFAAPVTDHALSQPAQPVTATVSSRWRLLAVSLLVLAMVAGIGVVGVGAVYWKFIRPTRYAPPSWGEHAAVQAAYPSILPANPNVAGWSGLTCTRTGSLIVAPGDPAPVRQLTCTDNTGVTSWFTEYPTVADADAYLNRHGNTDPTTTRETSARGVTVSAWRPKPGEPFALAFRSSNTPVVVELAKPDTAFEAMYVNWVLAAPF
ncbi:serine/threonine-protein kinase [Nocardia camponoti]|uniref:non-specific serine/threonine protein kinase n=1 Tax=Nocardia camponoti TaxID=1616106 RepID=A0A917V7I0_9NOCA|nr:serine/threonine-protein kinase [Nocardia camponoti]GGK47668.1 hypothetical protein GCM10011591_18730 [Nocardia camponoti]